MINVQFIGKISDSHSSERHGERKKMIPKISAHIEMVSCCSIPSIYLLTKTSPYSLMIYSVVLCKIITVGKLAVFLLFLLLFFYHPPPPQNLGHNSGQDFGAQIIKMKRWQTFGEDIN